MAAVIPCCFWRRAACARRWRCGTRRRGPAARLERLDRGAGQGLSRHRDGSAQRRQVERRHRRRSWLAHLCRGSGRAARSSRHRALPYARRLHRLELLPDAQPDRAVAGQRPGAAEPDRPQSRIPDLFPGSLRRLGERAESGAARARRCGARGLGSQHVGSRIRLLHAARCGAEDPNAEPRHAGRRQAASGVCRASRWPSCCRMPRCCANGRRRRIAMRRTIACSTSSPSTRRKARPRRLERVSSALATERGPAPPADWRACRAD